MRRRLLTLLGTAALALTQALPAHAISFIDSPTAYCRKIKGNKCVINWGFMSVNAAPNFMTDLWVFVEGELVYHAHGFFQQSMFVGNDFLGEGVPVKCGKEGTTPAPAPTPNFAVSYGSSYSWAIRARDSANLTSSNFGTVLCPGK